MTPDDLSPAITTAPETERDPLQDQVLADGAVSMAEMEHVLLAIVSCVEEQGFEADLTEFSIEKGHSFYVDARGADAAAGDQALASCEGRFLSDVLGQFIEDNGPSQAEIEAKHARIIECLEDKGYEVDGLDAVEAQDQVDAFDFADCEASS